MLTPFQSQLAKSLVLNLKKMLNYNCFKVFLILVLFTNSSFSELVSDDWLPKCCPEGEVFSGDDMSCTPDITGKFKPNATGSEISPPDILTITIYNETKNYHLKYRSKFNCLRNEMYVIDHDIHVTPAGDVVVYDESGDPRWLRRTEVCVDSVLLPRGEGLLPQRLFVALLCPCERLTCVHKCCQGHKRLEVNEGGFYARCVNANSSSPTPWTDQLLTNNSDRPFVMHGVPECEISTYISYLEGGLRMKGQGHVVMGNAIVPRDEYCADQNTEGRTVLIACRQLPATLKPTLYGGLFCVGAFFLGLTLALHLWLPDLRRTLHARVLLAHVTCLLVSYLSLAFVNLAHLPAPSASCSATALVIQFTILAAIFWLNVMCVDIAWTFSGFRPPRASLTLDSDGHKYLYYSLYAWGSTAAICAVTLFLEYSGVVPPSSHLKPVFGAQSCWFLHWESALLLVYGPMGLLLVANVALFVYTACKIQRTQRDTASVVQQQHAGSKLKEDTDRFSLYLKLFGLMGVTWIFEIVSWLVHGPDYFWYITDIINALRGVFIFVLFCLKKKVVVLIKVKLGLKNVPKFPRHPRKSTSSKLSLSMSSQRTNSFQLSHIS